MCPQMCPLMCLQRCPLMCRKLCPLNVPATRSGFPKELVGTFTGHVSGHVFFTLRLAPATLLWPTELQPLNCLSAAPAALAAPVFVRASGLCLRLRCGALAGGGLLLSLVGAGLLGQDNYNVEARWPVELKLQHDCLIAWCWFCHAGGRGNARLCARGLPSGTC